MDNLSNKPVSLLSLIPESTPVTPDISQSIIPTPQTFAQAFSAARRAGVKVFDYKGKKYGTQLKGETETMGKGIVAGVKTKQGNTSGSNKPIDNDEPVATVTLQDTEVLAKRYVANIGGKQYGFSSREEKDAFVDKVNRLVTDSLTNKKYVYDPNRNWYNNLKDFINNKLYTTKEPQGETETVDKGIVAGAKTKKGDTRGSNKPIDDDEPVATVNLPGVEVVAKKYSMANIGGREYWFPNEERKNAFVDRVNRAINDSLTQKKYGYNPKKNWYRTKIG